MTLNALLAICAVLGVPLAVSGLVYTARQQRLGIAAAARQAEKDRRDEIADAVAAAVRPVEKERDYFRDRADAFDIELRNRNGK